ncbi:MAG: GatB/YqeY domain-containing protein [Patescibacteria group bacterium]|nr:GatB/YqeY domain-containing protein [Patescibacteria group bacterium]
MKLKEKISQDFSQAFKEKNMGKKEVLSMVQSEIKNKEIELGKRDDGLDDDEVVQILSRAIKQRKDSVTQYTEGGRSDLAEKEQSEIEILQEYLPEQMSDEEVETQVKKVIEQLGASSRADMGKVMGAVMGALKGKVDGNKVKTLVEKNLGE